MPNIELHPAFWWACDECGQENYIQPRRIDPESEEGQEVAEFTRTAMQDVQESAEQLDLQLGQEWLVSPTSVSCKNCGSTYSVVHYDDVEDFDSDIEDD